MKGSAAPLVADPVTATVPGMSQDEPSRAASADNRERLVERAIAAELATGRREKTEEEARRGLIKRVAVMVAGVFLVIVGLVLIVLPGPGLVVLAAGLYLLATEVPFAARMLDRVKERLPQDEDGKLPKSAIVTMVAMTVVATGASIAWVVIK